MGADGGGPDAVIGYGMALVDGEVCKHLKMGVLRLDLDGKTRETECEIDGVRGFMVAF